MLRLLSFAIGLILLSVGQVWSQPFAGPGQRGFPFVRFSKVAAKAGFVNTPLVATSGGNATAALAVPVTGGLCSTAGCTDTEIVANATNAGTLIMTTQPATALAQGQFVFIDVQDSGTAPSDVYFVAGAGVTLKSLQPGLSSANLIGATTADKTARQQVCGVPPATGDLIYNALWISPNLYVTGCSSQPPGTFISPALVGGAQWQMRTVAGPGSDTVLASDTFIVDDATNGAITENLPACVAAGSVGANPGKLYIFKKKDSLTSAITLTPNGADTIDTFATFAMSAPSEQVDIVCSVNGGVWFRGTTIPWVHQYGGTDVTSVGSIGQYLTSNGNNFVVQSAARPVGFAFPGTIANSQIVSVPCTGTWNFPASMGGAQTFPDATAQATCDGAGPSGSADDFTISVCTGSGSTIACTQKADVSLAATTCVPTFNANAAFSCAAGNTLQVSAPASSHSEVNVGITLQGHTP